MSEDSWNLTRKINPEQIMQDFGTEVEDNRRAELTMKELELRSKRDKSPFRTRVCIDV